MTFARHEHGTGRDGRSGYTLIELVTVVVLTGILAVGFGSLLQHPMDGYVSVSRRAELVDLADLAARRLTHDVRRALPNSVRVSPDGRTLELLHAAGAGRYRAEPGVNDPGGPGETDHTNSSDRLEFAGDTCWNHLGRLQDLAFSYGTPLPAGWRIAVYPTGTSIWSEAASGASSSRITSAANRITVLDDGDEDQLCLDASHSFPLASPGRRFFFVEGPVTWRCEPGTDALWRIDGYAPQAAQPVDRTAWPLSAGAASRVVDSIDGCDFRYTAGTATRAALLSFEAVVEKEGERVRLLRQVRLPNAP